MCERTNDPVAEICSDGLDNDCDGEVDDADVCTPTCNANVSCDTGEAGICSAGLTTCPDGDFGAPFEGPLPSSGVQAVEFQGLPQALSTTNAADYALTSGPAFFTTNDCQTGRLGEPCPADCDCPANGVVDIIDFVTVLVEWGGVGVACDIDGDGIGIDDFLAVLGTWGACP